MRLHIGKFTRTGMERIRHVIGTPLPRRVNGRIIPNHYRELA